MKIEVIVRRLRVVAALSCALVLGADAAIAQVSDCTGKPAGMPCTADTNDCTRDVCSGGGACIHAPQPNLAPCSDDGNDCTLDICNGSATCTHPPTANLSLCGDDGNDCTRDFCNGSGTCSHPPAPNLSPCGDDLNECTRDFCNGAGTCTHPPAPNLSPCPDDGNDCTRDFCNGSSVCTHPPAGNLQACSDDGKSCTADYCNAGVCTHSGSASCVGNCATDPDGTKCTDDANACTLDVCQGGTCTHVNASPGASCVADASDCTFDQCNGAGACTTTNVSPGGLCTFDATDCTFDQCNGSGACAAISVGTGGPCASDSNECTFDQCNGAGTCSHTNIGGGGFCYDDGLDCTFEQCNGTGTCLHTAISGGAGCNDDLDNCTSDSCNSGTQVCDHTVFPSCTTPLQTSDQAKCMTGLNGAAVKLSAAQGKENVACIKAAASGSEAAPQSCLSADSGGKVDAAATKVTSTLTSKCGVLPDFGARATAPILASADDERRSLIADLFGSSLDGVVTATNEAAGKCQTAVDAALEKIVNAKLKSFVKCKKAGLKETIISRLGLDQCLLNVALASTDPASSLGKTIAKLAAAREKSCEGLTLSHVFPGDCRALTGAAFDQCADRLAECRACRIVVAVDGPFVNCDIFDDGAGNGSCPLD